MQKQQHTLFVCTTCASVWKEGKKIGESGGQQLLHKLQQLAQTWELHSKFSIQGVQCMSACNHACVIAFQGEEKFTYLFGNLAVDDSASAILQCATQYYTNPTGLLPWSERPEPLKTGILAKIPPLSKWAKLTENCC
ncbi:DUF1636 family protein [Sphaerospermopsis sp. LEGE 08334]|jgi:predicted metal-binding protein|uniref:DUF1636 family protein n=1 Tax=Sphaerospermopsis sp. LEGE 08334 TaxID=1828651 RepID=UPI001880FF9B|nr:DUF1636 family protein [Sphaerospermopsis sp. LEGE 08334]MBE9058215.1 DUF1636 family protein [Sphaerospermopsis sp. LEGE 08334]